MKESGAKWLTGCLSQLSHISYEDVGHRVIILNRGSMLAFQWREFSPKLRPQTLLMDKREIGDAVIPGERRIHTSPSVPPPSQLGPLPNERAVSSDVTLWRCTFWSGKFASVSSCSLARHALSSSIMTLWCRLKEVRCNAVSIVLLTQLSLTGDQPSRWTFVHTDTALMLPSSYYYTSMFLNTIHSRRLFGANNSSKLSNFQYLYLEVNFDQ